MPKYRQLHTKITDSFDFNDMPSDFHRITWVLLILIVDSEGRGIDNMAWVRSKMYPMREDIESSDLADVFDWFQQRKMICRYQVNGKKYFYMTNFKSYQSGTEKEAKSVLPAPPELCDSYSVPTPAEVGVAASASESVNEFAYESESEPPPEISNQFGDLEQAFLEASKLPMFSGGAPKWIESFSKMHSIKAIPADITNAVGSLQDKDYTIVGPSSIVNAVGIEIAKRNGNGRKRRDDPKRYDEGEFADFIER